MVVKERPQGDLTRALRFTQRGPVAQEVVGPRVDRLRTLFEHHRLAPTGRQRLQAHIMLAVRPIDPDFCRKLIA